MEKVVCVCVCVFTQIPAHVLPHSSAVWNESKQVCTPGCTPHPPPPQLTFHTSLLCQTNATHFEFLLHLILLLFPLLLLLPLSLLLLLQLLLLLFQTLLLFLLQLLLIRILCFLVIPAGERTITCLLNLPLNEV